MSMMKYNYDKLIETILLRWANRCDGAFPSVKLLSPKSVPACWR